MSPHTSFSIIIWFTFVFVAALSTSGTTTSAVCHQANNRIPNRIWYPSSLAYNESLSSYFSAQEAELRPLCIFSPENVSELSNFVKLISKDHGYGQAGTQAPQYAVRSGGHTPWAGAANIEGGITVDLRSMDSVVLSPDLKMASLGAGSIWSDIYSHLAPFNLSVMGGRVVGVGVGGFLTGGGISILSRQNGWACDNIYGYEVVLASGEIVYATASSHPDLWLSLKGGSNNFGIVTRFDVPTWPLSKLWGGALSFNYTPSIVDAHSQGFSDFMDPINFDDAASMFFALFYASTGRTRTVLDVLFYARPVTKPTIFDPFTSIETPNSNTLRLASVSDIVSEQPGSLPREANWWVAFSGRDRRDKMLTTRISAFYTTFTFKNAGKSVYNELIEIWEDITDTLGDVKSLNLGILFQPLPVTNGTNSLGLPVGETDLVLAALTSSYERRSDDDTVLKAMQAIQAGMEVVLRKEGLLVPFQYLNYAYQTQDPIGSYGATSKARLQKVSRNNLKLSLQARLGH
ncbi:hypothetical protein KVR01_006467 [Diaporthe batatas]|uniref:uncharacterized protein n=1 Tax=Diaporthe batatas TaxID=748121 RepID=UPI001D052156|nr:uncharacterized protein KVR01_006467 [Diaporthe batatas]KAG8164549.1 hypothetical protein KVR01_006467 [Diaporthe batatas]